MAQVAQSSEMKEVVALLTLLERGNKTAFKIVLQLSRMLIDDLEDDPE